MTIEHLKSTEHGLEMSTQGHLLPLIISFSAGNITYSHWAFGVPAGDRRR